MVSRGDVMHADIIFMFLLQMMISANRRSYYSTISEKHVASTKLKPSQPPSPIKHLHKQIRHLRKPIRIPSI